MAKTFTKNLSVIVVAAGAVAICGMGYLHTQREQAAQQVTYAQSTVSTQNKQLQELKETVASLYQDGSSGILAPTTTKETVDSVNNSLGSIQTSAESFGISDSQLPKGMRALNKEKEILSSELQTITAKLTLQTKIDHLFAKEVNWTTYSGDEVLKESVKDTDISDLKDRVSLISADDWQTLANQYLAEANSQQNTIKEIQTSIDNMYQDGTATDAANLDEYTTLVTAIDAVKNQTIRQSFVQTLNAINEQMGFGMPAQ